MRLPRIAPLSAFLAITLVLCVGAYVRGYISLAVISACVATVILAAFALSSFFIFGLKRLARKGDCYAMTKLGRMYADGTGVLRNHAKAMDWWRKAAERGYSSSMLFLSERPTMRAKVFNKIMLRRFAGIAWLLNKGIRQRSLSWERCITGAKARPKILLRRFAGIAWLRRTGTQTHRSCLGNCILWEKA